MNFQTDDLRVEGIHELAPPTHIKREFALTEKAAATTYYARKAIHEILEGNDDRLLVVIGPCSIHDTFAARDYAERLMAHRERLGADLEIIMRVYFEKPRTTIGWKGLINDPNLDESFNINRGLRLARELLIDINELGLPAGCEFLDMISPQYIADTVSWGAIGARTTESQGHRELASGLSCPVGFKNGTDGNIRIAIDAIQAASSPHHFLGVTTGGVSAIVKTRGNNDCHIILRGGMEPNYSAFHVNVASAEIAKASLPPRIMIDASHANSRKNHVNQLSVCTDIAEQMAAGDKRIFGVMVESNIVAGRQDLNSGKELAYGQSITDSCIGWEETVPLLDQLAAAVRARRAAR
ncbi:MAG: 3-deoxy-7-phosphoheptulonate synthase AroG [Cyanobacteria bacterium REEB67]|nr:3-deoxy-7-phosphoheptulonate synthase AroG [Cyanobacteria bacterium REEB67]